MRLRCRCPERADRGESLIEALVTIAILGIAVVALLGAVLMGVKTSALHRKHAQAQAELRSWGERISADSWDDCANRQSFAGPGLLPDGLNGTITAVQYWNGTTFGPVCNPSAGLQQVTLRITVAAGIHPGFSQDLEVVVRKPCASPC